MNNTTGSSTGHAGTTKEELKHDAERLAASAKQTAENKAEQGRDSTVAAAHSTQSALDKAAEELRKDGDAPDWLASAMSSAGSKIGNLANEIDGKPPGEMVDAVRRYGRQSPGLFMLAAGAAGFAAGRFLRAGAEENDDYPVDHDTGLGGHSSHRNTGIGSDSGGYGAASSTRTTTLPGDDMPGTASAGYGAGSTGAVGTSREGGLS